MLRIVFVGSDLVGIDQIVCADTYVKLVFADPDGGEHPIMRSYTVRSYDREAGRIEIDFALHGRGGVAAPWALAAQPGDTIEFRGIGGGYLPAPAAPRHLLIGDDSALPAIAVALEKLAAGSDADVVLIGHSEHDLLGEDGAALADSVPGSVNVRVVDSSNEVIELVDRSCAREGVPHVFLHGEADQAPPARGSRASARRTERVRLLARGQHGRTVARFQDGVEGAGRPRRGRDSGNLRLVTSRANWEPGARSHKQRTGMESDVPIPSPFCA